MAGIITGSGAGLQIGKENGWGNVVPGAQTIDFSSESIKLTPERKQQDTLLASKASGGNVLMGLAVDGDVSCVLRPEYAGYLLQLALGGVDAVTAGSPVTGANSHKIVLAEGNANFPSFTMAINRKGSVKAYSGCKIKSFSLSAAAGDFVKVTFTIIGKDESDGTMANLTALSLRAFKALGGTCLIGGATYPVKSIKFDLDNGMEDAGQTLASGLYHTEPAHGQRVPKVSIELQYTAEAETLYTQYHGTGVDVSSIAMTLLSPSFVIGTTPYSVQLTVNNVAAEITRNISGAGAQAMTLDGEAQSIGSTEPVIATVVDATAAAYSA